jgi:signal transduction histidine kinase
MGPTDLARQRDAEPAVSEGADVTFDRRKRFGCFSADDAALLAELRETFDAHADKIVDRFYEHLRGQDRLRPLLADPQTIRRLKKAQRRYLISLTSGRYDQGYSDSRLAIGKAHERIGLEPQWYLGTYGLYLELLTPLIRERFRDEPERALRAGAALSKLLILDMQVVLDAYYETRHRKAVQRSEQLAAVGELAASIAHEVRNPLAGMKGALEVLRTELAVKPSNLEIVDELLTQIGRLEHLVRDLLTFARPRALSRQPFDVQELLDKLLRLHKEEADNAGITVHRIYGPGTSELVADPLQMEQVFLNLLYNAMHAMEQGGTLTVSTHAEQGELVIGFEDTGRGIPPSELGRVFQPFFTTKHRGSGLGLPIVSKIIAAHGGTITVSSVVGRGTVATLRVPLGEAP